MVLGLGAGKIEIQLQKKEFTPGESIRGKIRLFLRKPTEARGIWVSFVMLSNNGESTEIYCEKKLASNRIYRAGEEFEFEMPIPVPKDLPLKPLSTITTMVASKFMRYYVKAWLDLPLKLDVIKFENIEVNVPSGQYLPSKGGTPFKILAGN